MPQIWIQQEGQEPPWAIVPLSGPQDVYHLTGDPQRPVVGGSREGENWPAYFIRHPGPGGTDLWVLFSSGQSRVAVNGVGLEIGMRALRDKDEIHVGECVLFFSTEQVAQIVPFPGGGKPCKCARCSLEIAPGTPAVACPRCGAWHHQSQELPCWTYAPMCAALGDQSTTLDGAFRWAPEVL